MAFFLGHGTQSPKYIKYLTIKQLKKYAVKFNIKSSVQWMKHVNSYNIPKEIPLRPDLKYKNQWKGWPDFLGTNRKPRSKKS
jgi:hypothetical protein